MTFYALQSRSFYVGEDKVLEWKWEALSWVMQVLSMTKNRTRMITMQICVWHPPRRSRP